MQELSDEQMDELFRKSAEEFEPPFESDHWQDMRRRLDERDRAILWKRAWRWSTPIILLLLLTGGYWYFNSSAPKPGQVISAKATDQPSLVKKEQRKTDTQRETEVKEQFRRPSEQAEPARKTTILPQGDTYLTMASVKPEIAGPLKTSITKQASKRPEISKSGEGDLALKQPATNFNFEYNQPSNRLHRQSAYRQKKLVDKSQSTSIQSRGEAFEKPANPTSIPGPSFMHDAEVAERFYIPMLEYVVPHPFKNSVISSLNDRVTYPDTAGPIKPVVLTQEKGLSVQFLVSPDLTAIGLQNFDRPGTNVGMMIQYRLSNRWSVQTGVMRSVKIYNASIEDYEWPSYYKWPVMPEGVAGRCNMLDIPLNIRYDVILRPHPLKPSIKSRWFVSSGITSYVMLRETYNYQYANPSDSRIKWRQWEGNTGNYKFSNLNLSVGYENQISHRLSWQVEPFIKVPLQQVGYFKARLLSTGAFFSLRYRL